MKAAQLLPRFRHLHFSKLLTACLLVGVLTLTACWGGVKGIVKVDGSSTVFPISEAVAEEFQKANPRILVTVGASGTGGGFQKFLRGELDIVDASRPIKASEKERAAANGIGYLELKVALDGLSVLVNPQNNWATSLTVGELRELWKPESPIFRWSQLRPGWPDEKIVLAGPGTDSGTFDYFTEAIVGEEGASRADYIASEDDNVLVLAIAAEKYALGYFGYAYYVENSDRLKLVAIDGGDGPVPPTLETINNGTYKPLSRPLFIYVNQASLTRPEVQDFLRFYLTEGPKLAAEVGYIPLPREVYQEELQQLAEEAQ